MSKNQFSFAHLDEDDDDEAQYQTGSLDLQPHLDIEQPARFPSQANDSNNDYHNNSNTAATTTTTNGSSRLSGVNNPALTTDLDDDESTDRKFAVSFERLSYSTDPQPDGSVPPPIPPPPRVENTLTVVEGKTTTTPVENGGKTADTLPKASTDPHNVGESSASPAEANPQSVNIQVGDPDGRVNVMQGAVVTRPDGSRYIDTRTVPPHTLAYRERHKPLRKERICHLKIFSIISCIFFFPSGIAAVYYAFRTETEFNEGILRGSIDRAQKFAKRSERFTILSFLMAIVVGCLIAAIIERPYYESHHHTGPYAG